MGLFSRKKSGQRSAASSRTMTSSEAQAAELRSRARRRLIGALVLVLAAVIIVPMLFDDPVPPEQLETPLVLPAVIPPVAQPDLALTTQQPDYDYAAGDVDTTETQPSVIDQPEIVEPDDHPASSPVAPQTEPQAQAPVQSAPKSEPSSQPTPPKAAAPADKRTDDGSVALALLEGRAPASGGTQQAATQGSFILQVAAYSMDADAQSRRASLLDAGVTNAYVEKGVSNDKTTYRLRVGPFSSRDAAQAAQARLRALGYDNSLLLTR